MGSRVWGLLGFKNLGFRVSGVQGFWIKGLRVWSLGSRFQGLGLGV